MTLYVVAHSHAEATAYQRTHLKDHDPTTVVLLSTRTPLGVGTLRGRRIGPDDQVLWLAGWSHGHNARHLVDYLAAIGWTGVAHAESA